MSKKIRLAALDMDGTLFNHHSQISETDQTTIKKATEQGVEIVISTGRPYVGLPVDLLHRIGIRYAITSNGAAVYELSSKTCLHSSCMEPALVTPIIRELQKEDIHMDAFIEGDGFSQISCKPRIQQLAMPQSIRDYILKTRTFTADLADYIEQNHLSVQKMTLNFYPLPDGSFLNRPGVCDLLSSHPEITYLSGGYHNLEFTKAGTTKGKGLLFLCEYLGIDILNTMACGDTQNDIDILKTAAIGVAMENATTEVKSVADYITLSNEESGVSHALNHFLFS